MSGSSRQLPSWMSSREYGNKSHGKKSVDAVGHGEVNDHGKREQTTGHGKEHSGSTISKENESGAKAASSSMGTQSFSKPMEGVVFVLSGFVNPERSILRSRALEMGAEYQPDWNSGCTLLVCAFPNTPKFRQVEADCGTIVSKDWISECYMQKKLVPIESYLMHAGKPWRRSNFSHELSQDEEASPPRKVCKQAERSRSKPTASASSEGRASIPVTGRFSPSNVKKWAVDDLNKTISWLESQEEKPEPSEVKKIATEGILTCLEDAIDSIKQEQAIQQMIEQWKFIPCVVEELAKLESVKSSSASLSKDDLYKEAITCKRIYEEELNSINDSTAKTKTPKTNEPKNDNEKLEVISGDAAYDSDETIEMTEEEIDLAYRTIASKFCK